MSQANEVRSDRRYTKEHEWAKRDGAELVIGITPFAVDQLGDITMVNFDVAVGDEVDAGKAFGTVESVKTVSDLFAPVSGRVTRINADLDPRPELVNDDCWEGGWMIAIAPKDPDGAETQLLDALAYSEHLSAEAV